MMGRGTGRDRQTPLPPRSPLMLIKVKQYFRFDLNCLNKFGRHICRL